MTAPIRHVVVLMLENRSFDSLLGMLKPGDPGFDGLRGTESNPVSAEPDAPRVAVWSRPGTAPATLSIPDPDPGELFEPDVNTQLFGAARSPDGVPGMQGFVIDYARQPGVEPDAAGAVMHHFTPDQVPVLSGLATAFGVSDRWHASAPCQTWPNRFFVHTATAGGYVNNEPVHFPYEMKTVFELLDKKDIAWRIYFHDVPQSATLAHLWLSGLTKFRLFEAAFADDAASGNLPGYSFIEPRYFSDGPLQLMPNDQHPPHDVQYGEALIATVYNALRSGPGWRETLFVVIYDEHGGIFDHVPPPSAPPPGGLTPDGFAFDRYGVRVPAVIVSPYVEAGSVIRPPGGLPFDHTSIIATLTKLFDLDGPLTGRDAAAPDLMSALDFTQPPNDGPARIEPPPIRPSGAEIIAAGRLAPNNHQRALTQLAAHLPEQAAQAAAHIASLKQGILRPEMPLTADIAGAAGYIHDRLRSLFG